MSEALGVIFNGNKAEGECYDCDGKTYLTGAFIAILCKPNEDDVNDRIRLNWWKHEISRTRHSSIELKFLDIRWIGRNAEEGKGVTSSPFPPFVAVAWPPLPTYWHRDCSVRVDCYPI